MKGDRLRSFFTSPEKGTPRFIAGMGVISIAPFVIPLFIFLFPTLSFESYALAQSAICLASFLIFGSYASKNEAIANSVNYPFAISFVFTCFLTMPLYWFIGILVPYFDQGRFDTNVRTPRVWALLLSLAPAVSVFLTSIWIYIFSSSLLVWVVPMCITLGAILYFSYHVLRYKAQPRNYELFWILSFFLTGTLSLPSFWYKRIYKPTLFPANVVVEAHELWIEDDNEHNLDRLEVENTAEVEFQFSSRGAFEDGFDKVPVE